MISVIIIEKEKLDVVGTVHMQTHILRTGVATIGITITNKKIYTDE